MLARPFLNLPMFSQHLRFQAMLCHPVVHSCLMDSTLCSVAAKRVLCSAFACLCASLLTVDRLRGPDKARGIAQVMLPPPRPPALPRPTAPNSSVPTRASPFVGLSVVFRCLAVLGCEFACLSKPPLTIRTVILFVGVRRAVPLVLLGTTPCTADFSLPSPQDLVDRHVWLLPRRHSGCRLPSRLRVLLCVAACLHVRPFPHSLLLLLRLLRPPTTTTLPILQTLFSSNLKWNHSTLVATCGPLLSIVHRLVLAHGLIISSFLCVAWTWRPNRFTLG